jgi:hypothetical protein
MRAATKTASLTGALALLIAAYVPGRAAAAPTPVTAGSSSFSSAANSGTASMAASLSLAGALGGLLQPIVGPIVAGGLNPLVSALQSTTNSLVASTLGASSGLSASTPSFRGSENYNNFPNDSFPSQCPKPDGTTPCYQASNTNVTSSLVTLAVPALRGYTQENQSGTVTMYGRAQVTNASVTLPFIPTVPGLPANGSLLSAAAVNSVAVCPNSGSTSPNAAVSAASVSLLGGLIALTVSNNSIATVTVGGTNYTLNTLPATAIAGVNLSKYGSALKISIPLTLQQLEVALNLSASAIAQLNANATSSASLTLTAIVGPNTVVTSTSAKAWGLGIGVDLSGSLGFNLAGLVGATVTVPSGIGGGNYGNLLDARLAYSACTSAASAPTVTPAVPPALI